MRNDKSQSDELGHTVSPRVTLEVRILDADVSTRSSTPAEAVRAVFDGVRPVVLVCTADADLCAYLCTHLRGAGAWEVVAAESERQAAALLAAWSHTRSLVLLLDAPAMLAITPFPERLSDTLRLVLLGETFPDRFEVRAAQHVLAPWPLDMPAIVQQVARFSAAT